MSEKITINDIKDLDKYETTKIQDAKSLDGKFVEEIEEYIKFFKKFDNNEIKKILSLPKDIIQYLKSFDNNEIKKILSLPEEIIQSLKSFDNNEIKKILSLPEEIIQYLKSFDNNEIKKILPLGKDKIGYLKLLENNEVKKIFSHTKILYLKIFVDCEEIKEGLFILGGMIYSSDMKDHWNEKVVLHKNNRDNNYNYYINMFIPFDRVSKENNSKHSFDFKFAKGYCWENGSNYKVVFDEESGDITKDNQKAGKVEVNYFNDDIWILVLECKTTTFNEERDTNPYAIDWKDQYVYN